MADKLVKALAIVATKNEKRHIAFVLEALINEGLEVVMLDDGSSDGTVELANAYLGRGLLAIHSRPDKGVYDWSSVLRWKEKIGREYDHEWLIHADADEWLQHPNSGMSLMELIAEADECGANAVDFEEFTFLPDSPLPAGKDPRKIFRAYYWHKPEGYGYLRAWKRSAGLTNTRSGGHGLHPILPWRRNALKIHAVKGVLRHYPILNAQHLREKYSSRNFAKKELSKGWHTDRVWLSSWNLNLSLNSHVFFLERPEAKEFNHSMPTKLHFWYPDWPGSTDTQST